MHIFITRKIPDVGLKILDENNISYDIGNFKKPPTKKDLIKSLKKKNYDGIITFLTDTIDKEILDVCPNIKIIANFSVGFNNLDIEELKKLRAEAQEKLADETSPFLTNVDKGSSDEIFFRVFMVEVPDSGVSINPQAKQRDGVPRPDLAAIETTPFKTDRAFIVDLLDDPLVKVLRSPDMPSSLRMQKELEQQGVFSTDTYKSVLRRQYDHFMKTGDKVFWQKTIELEGLSNVEPISDAEVEELVRPVIREAYKNKLGL